MRASQRSIGSVMCESAETTPLRLIDFLLAPCAANPRPGRREAASSFRAPQGAVARDRLAEGPRVGAGELRGAPVDPVPRRARLLRLAVQLGHHVAREQLEAAPRGLGVGPLVAE